MEIKKFLSVRNIVFVLLLLIFIVFVASIKDIALLFFAAYVIACSLMPLVDKLSCKIPRSVAAGLVVIAAAFLVLLVFIPVFVVAVKEGIAFMGAVPERVAAAKEFLVTTKINGIALTSFINLGNFGESLSNLAQNIVSSSINITVAATEYIAVGLSVIMIVFYMLLDKQALEKKFAEFFPSQMKDRALEILTAVEHRVGGYIIAQGLSMLVVGVVTGLGLLIFKIKYSIVLGLIAGLLDIIPIVGPIFFFFLGAITAVQNGWLYLIPVAFIYIGAQWLSNQIIRPVVFARFMDLHPIFIIFAFLVCAKFLGVCGVILAPAITSLFTVLIDELYLKTINKPKEAEIEIKE